LRKLNRAKFSFNLSLKRTTKAVQQPWELLRVGRRLNFPEAIELALGLTEAITGGACRFISSLRRSPETNTKLRAETGRGKDIHN
jgi:hypothetical protein